MTFKDLMTTRRFLPLFVAQYASALDDNIFKNAMGIMILFLMVDNENAPLIVTWSLAVFILPYVLLSPLAGRIADTHDKAAILKWVSFCKVICFILGAIGFYIGSVPLLLVILFVIGINSAFFSPCKYSILPDHLSRDNLLKANGLLSMGTFLAIITGTIAGGLAITTEMGKALTSAMMIGTAVIGYLAARMIPPAPAPVHMQGVKISYNPARGFGDMLGAAFKNPSVRRSVLGSAWFWFMGAVYMSQIPVMAKTILNANEQVITFFMVCFSVGIATGSMVVSKILKDKISLRMVVPSGILLSFATFDLAAALWGYAAPETVGGFAAFTQGGWANIRIMIDLAVIACAGGMFYVPMYAAAQAAAEDENRARAMATLGFMNSLAMVIAAGLSGVLMKVLGFDARHLFVCIGLINLGVLAAYFRTIWDK